MVTVKGKGMTKMTPLCQNQGWEAECFTHMLAGRCCWEPGRLTMAVECPEEAGMGW